MPFEKRRSRRHLAKRERWPARGGNGGKFRLKLLMGKMQVMIMNTMSICYTNYKINLGLLCMLRRFSFL